MAKAKKPRAKKYDEKLKIEGSFEDVIKVSVQPHKSQKSKQSASPKKTAKK